MLPKVRIIHETNPEKYFPAVLNLANQGRITLLGTHRYSVLKEAIRSSHKDKKPAFEVISKAAADFWFRASLPFIENEIIILGFAPWDFRMLFYRHLAKTNKIIYHTSWHNWNFSNTPKQMKFRPFQRYLVSVWKGFLKHQNVTTVAVTNHVKSDIVKRGLADPVVIPHAVPNEFFDARKSLPKSKMSLNLLYVGELSEKKGVLHLLQLMNTITNSNLRLTIVGTGLLRNKVANHPDPRVVYVGAIYNRAELAAEMSKHDVLVLFSQKTSTWEELFGIVIIEALAAGLTVLASDHVGPTEILEKTSTSGLVESSRFEKLIDKVCELLDDPDKLLSLRAKQQDIPENYRISSIAQKWEKLLNEL